MRDHHHPAIDDRDAIEIHWTQAQRFRIAHEQALAEVLGAPGHTIIADAAPFAAGGPVGVGIYDDHLPGVVYSTLDIVGFLPWYRQRDPMPNAQGLYELAIATRAENAPACAVIRELARHVFDTAFEPGQTLDIAPLVPVDSSVTALLFHDYARFRLGSESCGVLLCIGITEAERQTCLAGHEGELLEAMRLGGVFPFTDWKRPSLV